MTPTAKPKINLSHDGQTIHIVIPVTFQRHRGKKTILSPQGQPVNSDRNAEQDATLLAALVKAHGWDQWLTSGKVRSVNALSRQENIRSKGYVSSLLRLTLLAPDIQTAIVLGKRPTTLTLSALMKPFPLLWEVQRQRFGFTV